jgi:hypothetical protein
MHSRFSLFRKDRDWHPDEGDLLLYLDGEQPSRIAARIRLHLEACWACRVEAERIGQTISAFMDYRNRVLLPSLPSVAEQGGRFESKLHALAMQTQAKRQSWPMMLAKIRFSDRKTRRAPLAAVGVAAVLVLGLAITVSYVWSPTVNAQQLLAHASAVEEAHENNPSVVLHRSLQLEKRKYKDKKVLLRRRIDVWHSGARGITARRVYDDSGNLVAGEWSKRGGSSTVYERGTRSNFSERDRNIPKVLDSPEDLWQYDLSASSFEGLVGTAAQAQVDKQGTDYVVHYAPRDRSGNNRMLSAVLTVRESDFRAVALELTMRESEVSDPMVAANIPVVYSITEASFEQRPALEVNPQVFQTDAELLALSLPTGEGYATADLQIETTYLLDRVGATLGQEVTVTVGADHKLHVEGVEATELRRAQIIKALAPVRHNPAVVINLITVDEALQRKRAQPFVVTETVTQAERASIPLFDELSRYFEAETAPGSPVDVRAKIRRLSEQILEDSGEAMRHAWVLKRLAGTISPTEIGSLSETPHNEYLCMVAAHAQEVGERTEKLRLQLGPIIFPNELAAGQAGDERGTSPTDLAQAIQQLFAAASRNDAAVQSSFSVTTGRATEGAVKVQEIQSSLLQVEQLAKWIRHAADVSDCGPALPRKQVVR